MQQATEEGIHRGLFTEATFGLRKGARWVRLEIIGPEGDKAWSNPIDLRD